MGKVKMTDSRIKELLEFCEKATKGPWDGTCQYGLIGDYRVSHVDGPDGVEICIDCSSDNALFIAAARTALPEALHALAEARKALGEAMWLIQNLPPGIPVGICPWSWHAALGTGTVPGAAALGEKVSDDRG